MEQKRYNLPPLFQFSLCDSISFSVRFKNNDLFLNLETI